MTFLHFNPSLICPVIFKYRAETATNMKTSKELAQLKLDDL